ncbi:MAG: MSHA pilin protein MshA [Colwellia sp.]|jgi:MSHA pilin protein MshA|tara:strand:+ start:74 stop:529 length:456 start_codon:yes stop_codon:yes gene_type:complete
MKNLTKQKGFTLIELVVVIVILGILAVTAAPKFIDLTGDAKGSVIEAVKGSMNSAADLAHAKALVQGQAGDSGAISAAGSNIVLVNGWPNAASIGSLLDYDTDVISGSAGTFEHVDAATGTTCHVVYTNSAGTVTDGTAVRPDITTTITGC